MDKSLHPADMIAEANHRVANSLSLLGGLVRMQARVVGKNSQTFSNAEICMMFDGIAARIATISQLHRMLANVPNEGSLSLAPHLRDVCSNLVTAFSSEQQPLKVTYHGGECLVLTRLVQPLTLIICEVLTNALKYAHPAGAPLLLTVACESKNDGTLCVSIADDGVGLPVGFDPQKDGGVGFRVIRALTSEMGAALAVDSDNLGVTVHLTIPQALVANVRSA